jgi:hypothetical protein
MRPDMYPGRGSPWSKFVLQPFPPAVSIRSFGGPLLAVNANPVIASLYPWKDLAPIKLFSSNSVYTCDISLET